jgi:hypothetical protein
MFIFILRLAYYLTVSELFHLLYICLSFFLYYGVFTLLIDSLQFNYILIIIIKYIRFEIKISLKTDTFFNFKNNKSLDYVEIF